MPPTQGKRFVVEVSDELHRRVRVLAAEEDITIANLVREAIEHEIARRRSTISQPERRDRPPHSQPARERKTGVA